MWFVLSIIGLMLAADAWWWWFAHRLSRRAGLGRGWRIAIGITMSTAILGLILLLVARMLRMHGMIMPEWAVKLVFVWHFLVLPLVFLPSVIGKTVLWLKRAVFPPKPDAEGPSVNPSRRAFLAQTMIVVPPAITLAMTGHSVMTRDDFRVRRLDVPLRNLPPALEGLTIAQITDPHVGSFMSDAKYQAIIRATNELDADLILQGGDLINHSLNDLPDGIQMLQQMRARYGVLSCQGNHDCIESRAKFEEITRRADIGMLLDESRVLQINGQALQVIAPRWGARTDDGVRAGVERVLKQRRSDAFAILLAHHPHAFDSASDAGIPLTLGGHTHGGQFQLIEDVGFGPLMYKYWSGLYRKGDSATIVSNGIGNWFPLRINVPCEIIHLTLRRA